MTSQDKLIRAEAPSSAYDELYSSGAAEAGYSAYDRHYSESHYYPLYKAALKEAVRCGPRSVLEVGCGSGSFAHLLLDRAASLEYHGFDFSEAAISKAKARTGKPELFSVARAGDDHVMNRSYDTIICLEVLEHIERDLDVVEGWPPGANFVCSVPNFDSHDHVRFFRHEDEVRKRYESLLDIRLIRRVPRALVRGRGWREYARQLRWSRNDPKRVLGMLGINTFEYVAGWLVFAGCRRA